MSLWTLIPLILAIVGTWTFVVVQFRWGLLSLKMFREAELLPELPEDQLPSVAIFMGIRGKDPSLEKTLSSLLAQDHPNYRVFVVVDSEQDPAWETVRSFMKKTDSSLLDVSVLENPPNTCSLKAAALIQCIQQVGDSFDVIATVDSDLELDSGWLRKLLRPFQDPNVSITGGFRWFHASAGGFGTLLRYCWNSFAVGWMSAYHAPWGGCMAIRREFIFSSGMYDDWHHCLAEDMIAATKTSGDGKGKFAYAPIIGNCFETIPFRAFLTYGRRQLMYAYTHHKSWPIIFMLGVFSYLATVVVLAALVYHSVTQQWGFVIVEGLTIAGYWSGLAIIQGLLESKFGGRHRFTAKYFIEWTLAGLLMPCIQFEFALFAPFRRRVLWRGIEYDTSRKGTKRLNYEPYVSVTKSASESVI